MIFKNSTLRKFVITVFAFSISISFLGAEYQVTKVGVIDVLLLIDKYDKSKDLEDKLKLKYEEEEKKLEQIKNEIKELKRSIKISAPAKKESLLKMLRKKEYDFKFMRDSNQEYIAVQHRKYTKEVYNDIKKIVKMFGKENGFDLILKKSTFENASDQQMQMEMVSNTVLYNRSTLEITDDILKMLNAHYKQLAKKK